MITKEGEGTSKKIGKEWNVMGNNGSREGKERGTVSEQERGRKADPPAVIESFTIMGG